LLLDSPEMSDELRLQSAQTFPANPKAIFSCVAWYYDELFKSWAAPESEKGTLLIGMQHGGNYGSAAYQPSVDHEIKITDRYFTWGWDRQETPTKVIPWLASKLTGRRSFNAENKKEGILFVATTAPRYLFQFPRPPYRFEQYLVWQSRFLAALNKPLLSRLRVRFHREDMGWDMPARWKECNPAIPVETWDIPFLQSLADCRIYVSDHMETTYIEALFANKPTILFWDPEINELRTEAQPYYELLRTAGILHDTPEAAAAAVSRVYDDVIVWWNNTDRQKARKTFCDRFARTSTNAVDQWAKEFERISKEGIKTP